MDDHFYSSLHELKQQLDLMNQRTALFLKRHSLQNYSGMSLRDPSNFDRRPVAKPQDIPMHKFHDKLNALEVQQEAMSKDLDARFMDMALEIDALSDELDDMRSGNPHFTPPESLTSPSSSASPTLPVHETSNFNSSLLDTPATSKPPATIADIGGHFHPNSSYRAYGDIQCISDASIFVGRVNRALRTKSVTNIETFLKGPALRWFHIGLSLDGSHSFDDEDGQTNMAKFCESLMFLFGAPGFIATEDSYEQAQCLMLASMRSDILEDYAFPALEALRRQTTLGQPDADAAVALRQAVLRYNKDHPSFNINPDVIEGQDVLVDLAQLRRREFDNRRDKTLAHQEQRDEKAEYVQIPADGPSKANLIPEQPSSLLTEPVASKVGQDNTHTKILSCDDDVCVVKFHTENQGRLTDQERKIGTQSMFEEDHQQQFKSTRSVSRACSTQRPPHKAKRSTGTVVQPGTIWSNVDSTTSGTSVHGGVGSDTPRPSSLGPQSMFSFPCLPVDSCPTPPSTLCPPPPSNLNLTPNINTLSSGATHQYPGYPLLNTTNYAPYDTVEGMPEHPMLPPVGSIPAYPMLHPTSYHNGEGVFTYKPPKSTQSNTHNLPPTNTGSEAWCASIPNAPPTVSTQSTNYNPSVNSSYESRYAPSSNTGPPPAAPIQSNNYTAPQASGGFTTWYNPYKHAGAD